MSDYYGVPFPIVQSWVRAIVVMRNICAHGGILYDRYPSQTPKAISELSGFNYQTPFAQLPVLLYLFSRIDEDLTHCLVRDCVACFGREPIELLSPLGFSEGWIDLLRCIANERRGKNALILESALSLGRVA